MHKLQQNRINTHSQFATKTQNCEVLFTNTNRLKLQNKARVLFSKPQTNCQRFEDQLYENLCTQKKPRTFLHKVRNKIILWIKNLSKQLTNTVNMYKLLQGRNVTVSYSKWQNDHWVYLHIIFILIDLFNKYCSLIGRVLLFSII